MGRWVHRQRGLSLASACTCTHACTPEQMNIPTERERKCLELRFCGVEVLFCLSFKSTWNSFVGGLNFI